MGSKNTHEAYEFVHITDIFHKGRKLAKPFVIFWVVGVVLWLGLNIAAPKLLLHTGYEGSVSAIYNDSSYLLPGEVLAAAQSDEYFQQLLASAYQEKFGGKEYKDLTIEIRYSSALSKMTLFVMGGQPDSVIATLGILPDVMLEYAYNVYRPLSIAEYQRLEESFPGANISSDSELETSAAFAKIVASEFERRYLNYITSVRKGLWQGARSMRWAVIRSQQIENIIAVERTRILDEITGLNEGALDSHLEAALARTYRSMEAAIRWGYSAPLLRFEEEGRVPSTISSTGMGVVGLYMYPVVVLVFLFLLWLMLIIFLDLRTWAIAVIDGKSF